MVEDGCELHVSQNISRRRVGAPEDIDLIRRCRRVSLGDGTKLCPRGYFASGCLIVPLFIHNVIDLNIIPAILQEVSGWTSLNITIW